MHIYFISVSKISNRKSAMPQLFIYFSSITQLTNVLLYSIYQIKRETFWVDAKRACKVRAKGERQGFFSQRDNNAATSRRPSTYTFPLTFAGFQGAAIPFFLLSSIRSDVEIKKKIYSRCCVRTVWIWFFFFVMIENVRFGPETNELVLNIYLTGEKMKNILI